VQVTGNRMFVTEQRARGRDRGAVLLIGVDLDAHRARIRTQATAVAAILVAGLLVSFLLSTFLRGMVAKPIAGLASTAREIADRGDYSIRAANPSHDEIGVLIQTFNRMLDEIQASQRERADLLDREQQANRLKDEFLATLSHELRTPLNAIVGWVHLLRRGQLPPEEIKHALERIDRNAHAQARLVQDLLDVSRITTGKLLLDIREIDLATVALNAIDACRPAAEARQVALVTQFAGTFPTMGDPDRLQQVLWNLISNAVRFTPAAGTVSVTIARADETDTIEVRDNGAGIEPQFIPFMFEPFRQADAASTRSHGGLGIGLTIVRRLTEMHGGTVSVASDGPGKGATLTVTLPVRRTSSAIHLPMHERQRVASLAEATVLVVEDDKDTLELLESTLRLAGATPLGARSVGDAMRVVDGHKIDALVSDIAMPGQDGYTLLTLLKDRLGPAMPDVSVALTAYAGRADRVPEVEPLPEVDLRERRVRPASERPGARPARPGRTGGTQPAIGGVVGRGQGPAARLGARALWRPAAAAVHRARAGGPAGNPADGRAGLGAGSHRHAAHRRVDLRAEAHVHDRHRHAQHAAGGARLRLHGVLLAGQAGGIRPDVADINDAI
jgi:signal transduction histidine kinase/CheY-like chemotaxis protein